MGVLARRFFVIALSGLIGAGAVGLLAPNATVLVLGILALGVGMIMGILFYLLRPVPVPGVSLVGLPKFPSPAPVRQAVDTLRRGQRSADIIVFPRAPE